MTYTTLISTNDLVDHLDDPNWAILDCRFILADPEHAQNEYLQAHIPGAIYAHLNHDLSSTVIPGVTGRHPLPTPEAAAETFSSWGIGSGVQVVAYDDAGGALAAVRAWWMLRWLGHDAVAVLDGGWQKWLAENRPVRTGVETRPPRQFIPRPRSERVTSTAEVEAVRHDSAFRVFDARVAERYQGRNETIDPVAGHIPGALSAPYLKNLASNGVFRPPDELRRRYQALLGGLPAERAIFYCGSGVTSIHNILAMVHAGLGESRLYAGSWSEWIADGKRPVEK